MRIAVPNKGRLHDPAIDLLERAGLHIRDGADRKLYADTVDPDVSVLFARAADIPEYVADDAAAVGITGLDQVRESGVDLADLLDLDFGRCRLVLAAPEDGPIESVDALANGTVATEFPNITRRYFADKPVSPEIVEVSGATELTPHVEIADAIVDITSTGTTLRMNRLAVVDEVLESAVHLFADPEMVDDPKVRQIETALDSVLAAEDKRYLMMNVPEDALATVEDVIPGMGGPTVMDVDGGTSSTSRGGGDREGRSPSGNRPEAGDTEEQSSSSRASGQSPRAEAADGQNTLAVHVVVDEREVFETITRLKEAGASDILVTEIERLVE